MAAEALTTMKKDLTSKVLRIDGAGKFKLDSRDTKLKQPPYRDEAHYELLLTDYRREIDELQQKLYAHDRFSVLLIFQAMDGAGKDSTIRHVMTGVNPTGVEVTAFKRPSEEELDHDFLWRTTKALPQRGRIGIFNRSYYEEVLVTRVHPEIVTQVQKLPREELKDMDELWEKRYRAIREFERHLHNNGTIVLKFFLNVSKREQGRRFLERIDNPAKNWKFSSADLKERARWDDYQKAYQTAIRETATKEAPWFVVPADDKLAMRLMVSDVVVKALRGLKLAWPKLDKDALAELAGCRAQLLAEE